MDDIPWERRLFPAAIDYRAHITPDRPYAYLSKGEHLEDGFFVLGYKAFAKAVDATAWWLDDVLEDTPSTERCPTVPYIGLNDFRYALLLIGLLKTGRKLMLPLPTNTTEGLAKLVKNAHCTTVLAAKSQLHVWKSVSSHAPALKIVTVPELDFFIHDRPTEHYAYHRTAAEGIDDCMYVIQTSGTTGEPKPINLTYRTAFAVHAADASRNRTLPPESRLAITELNYQSHVPNLLPISWLAGLTSVVDIPLFFDSIPIVLPASMPQPMTASYVVEIMRHTPKGKKNGINFVPSVLRDLAGDVRNLEDLKKYSWMTYVGAPLDHATGDFVRDKTGVRIQAWIGSTETGGYPMLLNNPADWKMHRFDLGLHGFYLEHFADDLHELCIKRQENDRRHCFSAAPDKMVHHTSDLWRPVPGREGFWTNAGRVDDFVKLASLTKFNAISIEQTLERNPVVARCLVAGNARERPFVIVELSEDLYPASQKTMDLLWAAIEAANSQNQDEGRIPQELVLIADHDKPIQRTAKGTNDRRKTLAQYEGRINRMYEQAGFKPLPYGADSSRN